MRVLFFMPHPGATRNFESTIRGLAHDGHHVHLAFDRTEKRNLAGVWDLTETLVAECPEVTWSGHPQLGNDDPGLIAGRLRASLDYMRYFNPEFEGAPKLRRRAENWAPPRVRERYSAASRPTRAVMRAAFRAAERSAPTSRVIEQYLEEQNPDVVLVTPFLEPGTVQTDYVREAKRRGIATCLCVHSWDNLTNKGLIHELPDAVAVWNEMQSVEATELHDVPAERVVVTGATPYDHWFGWKPSRSRAEFSERVGLDPARPFVLYVGSSGFIAPDEAAFVLEWDREIRRRGLQDVQILVRPHPVNPLKGRSPSQIELARLTGVHLYPPDGANPTDEESRNDYFDSLHFCSAVVGVNTSAFLEAAIHRRPVFSVRIPRYEDSMKGTLHFHHLLSAGGGLLQVADSYDEHAAQLAEALAAPHPEGCISERSTRFAEVFIRPYGLDEPATPRTVELIEALPDRLTGGQTSRGTPVIGPLLVRIMRRQHAKALSRSRADKRERERLARERRQAKAARRAKRARKVAKAERGPKPPKVKKGKAKPPQAGSASQTPPSSSPSSPLS
jgi:hypothetical protein